MLNSVYDLDKAAVNIRKRLLELCNREVIHIGGDLSITDVMTVLWQYQMRYNPQDTKMSCVIDLFYQRGMLCCY